MVKGRTQDLAGRWTLLDASQNLGPAVSVLEQGPHQLFGLVRSELMSQRTFALCPPVLDVLQACTKDYNELTELSPQHDIPQRFSWIGFLLSFHLKKTKSFISCPTQATPFSLTNSSYNLLIKSYS